MERLGDLVRPKLRYGLALALAGVAANASAAEWRVTPSVTVEESYNDNIDLAPEGSERDDFITRISPGLSVRGDGARVRLNFDYAPEALLFLDHSDENEFRQQFRGSGQAELLQEFLFFDADASISQAFVDSRGAIGGSDLTASNNLNEVRTYRFGPTLRHHFGTIADAEARYQFGAVSVQGSTIADTITNDISLSLSSGRYFGNLGWQVQLSRADTERSDSTDSFINNSSSQRDLANLSLQYAVNSYLSLIGSTGYEKIEDETLLDQPDGLIWDAGFLLRPNRRASVRLSFGERYGGHTFNGEASYEIAGRTFLSATYSDTIETSQDLIRNSLNFLRLDDQGNIIDGRTGLPFVPGDPLLGLENNAFQQERFSLAFRTVRGRNTYSIQAFSDDRTSDRISESQDAMGASANWGRQLSRATNLDVGASYRTTEFEDGREDDFYTLSAGLTYRMTETLFGTASYRYSKRASNSQGDIVENLFLVRVRKLF